MSVVIAIAVPLLVSVCALRVLAGKDSFDNNLRFQLIIGGSYLLGLAIYALILNMSMTPEALQNTLLAIVMMCLAVTIATGGAAVLALDANTTIKSITTK